MKKKHMVKVGVMLTLGIVGVSWQGGSAEGLRGEEEVLEELNIESIVSESKKKENIEGYDIISYEYRKQEEFKRLESLRLEEERVGLEEQEREVYLDVEHLKEGEGLNYKGYQYELATFQGSNMETQEGVNVYQWLDLPSHYLVESTSHAGETLKKVGEGEEVILEGITYVVDTVKRGVPNDSKALSVLMDLGGDITIQTSENRPEGMSSEQSTPLALWTLNKK